MLAMVVSCVTLIGGATTSILSVGEEPMYDGKPLSYWIEVAQQTGSPSTDDQKAAPAALRAIGEPAVPGLVKLLTHDAAMVRLRAVSALLGMDPKPKAAVPALITALADSDKNVRHFSPQVLAEIGPDAAAAVPALITALKDPAMEVRHPAAMALGAIGAAAKDALPALSEALEDEDNIVREEAAAAIAKISHH